MRAPDQHDKPSSQRGYDARWRVVRAAYLAEHPLCECDQCQAGAIRLTKAEVVNHIREIADRPDLRLDWSNLQAMSKRCHDRHTMRTRGPNGRRMQVRQVQQ